MCTLKCEIKELKKALHQQGDQEDIQDNGVEAAVLVTFGNLA